MRFYESRTRNGVTRGYSYGWGGVWAWAIGLMILIGFAIEYWYIVLAVVLVSLVIAAIAGSRSW